MAQGLIANNMEEEEVQEPVAEEAVETPEQEAAEAPESGAPEGGAKGTTQEAIERTVFAGLKVIHTPQVKQQLLQIMKSAPDPSQGIAEATYLVMSQLYEKSGRKIPADALGAASMYILQEIAQLGEAAKLFKATPEMVQGAVKIGMQKLQNAQQQPAQEAPVEEAPAAEAAAPAGPPAEEMTMGA
jgi:hypothetical protein